MTNLQIAYYNAENQKQHWERQDALTKEQLHYTKQQVEEQVRHNLVNEALNYSELDMKRWFNEETIRLEDDRNTINRAHYERSDATAAAQVGEAARHNREVEQLGRDQLQLELSKEFPAVEVSGNTFIVDDVPRTGVPMSQSAKRKYIENTYLNAQQMSSTANSWFGTAINMTKLGRILGNIFGIDWN